MGVKEINRRRHYLIAVAVFAVAIALRFAVALAVYGRETGDIYFFRVLADTVLAGGSPYDLPWQYAAYPPFWLHVMPSGLRAWAYLLGLSFDFVFKIPPMLMDGFVSTLTYLLLVESNFGSKSAFIWSLLYALNPLTIYNNAIAGQMDSLPIGLAFVAALMASNGKYRWLLLGALTLGFAMSFKSYPLVFLPFFMWQTVRRYRGDWAKVGWVVALVLVPWAIQLLPFVFWGRTEAVARMLNYMFLQSGGGGLGHIGSLAIVKWIGLPVAKLTVESVQVPASWGIVGRFLVYILDAYRLLLLSKFVFGCAYLLVCATGRRLEITFSILLSLLLIFVFIGGYFAYYLMWLVPFATILRRKWVIPYSLVGIVLIVTEHPAANLIFWGICLTWLIKMIVDVVKLKNLTSLLLGARTRGGASNSV